MDTGPRNNRSTLNNNRFTLNNNRSSSGMVPLYWGPPAWRLLEQVAYNPIATPGSKRIFFKIIGKILPCRSCRESYQRFIRQLPIDNFLENNKETSRWLYQIHNKVNEKIRRANRSPGTNEKIRSTNRSPGTNEKIRKIAPDPTFKDVYKRISNDYLKNRDLPMWDFLYTVALNYNPQIHQKRDYKSFFETLSRVIPYHQYQEPYQILLKNFPIQLDSREDLFDWLYVIEQTLTRNRRTKESIRKKIDAYRASKF